MHRVAQRRTRNVDAVADPLGAFAGEGTAPEQRGVEPRPLLVHEGDHPERPLGREALPLQALDGVHRRHDPERPVEPAAGRDGVEVRADEHGLPGARLPAAEEVAGRVDLDPEAERSHPFARPGVGGEELLRPRDARDAAAGACADACELVEARRDGLREHLHVLQG